ncbi:MAG: diguanylate cyclase [Nitrospirae bacterium]|nr:diguanylate cyclase [Nitrospirota bacterium]
MNVLDSLRNGAVKLPSLPVVAAQVIKVVKNDEFSLRELEKIISCDPALTAKILSVVNSSFYAVPYKVDSIDKALSILGVNGRDDIFVTALLMDIGVAVMFMCKPDDYMKVFNEKFSMGTNVVEAEHSIFGFNHQTVSSQILKQWNLPENIYMPIAYHHNKDKCPAEFCDMVDILAIADLASSIYHGSSTIEKLKKLERLLKDKFNVAKADVESFIDSVAEKTIEVLATFEIDASDMKPHSIILQEAVAELGKLNMSYEQLVMGLKESTKKAEKYAGELQKVNEKLKVLAFSDSLTGLFNHRYFQEQMEKELYKAERNSLVLSLIMIDIDNFKKINDTYGHSCGDKVLTAIGETIQASAREADTAARYGGEELVIILPETDMQYARVIAEKIRENVEKLLVRINDYNVNVTISAGISTYEPQRGIMSKAAIIETADRALYNSKMSGKNKVSTLELSYYSKDQETENCDWLLND